VLAAARDDIGAAFSNVSWCVSSGDVLPKRTFDRFLARTGQPIRSLYGSTEAGSICMDTGPASEVRFGSLGLPLRNVEIEVRGEAGQIWVKSPAVFCDGFYDTGDLGRMEEGRLVMTGRKQTFFDVAGHKVDLGEVEEVLLVHPQVREAAAVGIQIPNIGGAIKAVAVVNGVCREVDLLDHCRKHLASYKIPRFVEFREMLPRSPLGKVLRKELADPASWLIEVPPARDIPEAPRARQIDWLAQRIGEQVATILRCEPAEVPRDVPFQSLGFDSLRAAELQDRLSRMSGVALSITTLFNCASVEAYAAFLLDAMRGPAPRQSDPLDGFSEDEIAEMLAKELSR
jgi:long-chain acyl-CoA synthetase